MHIVVSASPTDPALCEGCAGARLQGLRHIVTTEAQPDTDVITQAMRQPHRAVEVLVDVLPDAVLVDSGPPRRAG